MPEGLAHSEPGQGPSPGRPAVPVSAEVPARARRAARDAFPWRSASRGGPDRWRQGGTRSGDEDPCRLVFVAAPLGIEIEFLQTRIVGQVIPPGGAEITVESQEGTTIRVRADDLGFFVVPCRPAGAVRICCERPEARLVTSWMTG
jgi:hypothetical protein